MKSHSLAQTLSIKAGFDMTSFHFPLVRRIGVHTNHMKSRRFNIGRSDVSGSRCRPQRRSRHNKNEIAIQLRASATADLEQPNAN